MNGTEGGEHVMRTKKRGMALGALALSFLLVSGADPTRAEAGCKQINTPTAQISKQQARQAIKCQINRQRANRRSLKLNRQLNKAAQRHTRKMASGCGLSHQCPGEAHLTARVRQTGYLNGAGAFKLGETIAQYPRMATPRDIVAVWMRSRPHRKILLGRFKHVGVGVIVAGRYAWYTAVFGNR